MADHYILNDDNSVSKASLMEWAEWFEKNSPPGKRRVAWTELGEATVSTVFLGLDHSFGYGAPLVFETLVFPGNPKKAKDAWDDQLCWRYSTYEEAYAGHWKAVEATQKFIDEGKPLKTLYEVEQPEPVGGGS